MPGTNVHAPARRPARRFADLHGPQLAFAAVGGLFLVVLLRALRRAPPPVLGLVFLMLTGALHLGCGPSAAPPAAPPAVGSAAPRATAPGGTTGPVPPLADEGRDPGGGTCVVGLPPPESIVGGAGAALVWTKTLPESLVPGGISTTPEGEVAVAGVLERGAFADLAVEGYAFSYVVASFDASGTVRFVRPFGSARGVSRPRPLVVHDADGVVVAATEAGPQGGRDRVVVAAFDRRGNERYRRVFAGPRRVTADALLAWPDGGALLGASFEEAIDGVDVPRFEPPRFKHALLAVLDTQGRSTRLKVLPAGTVLALATHRTAVAVAARVEEPTRIAGTVVRSADTRLEALTLVASLDRRSLEPRWMVPLAHSLEPASLAFTSSGEIWLGHGARPRGLAAVVALDLGGKPLASPSADGGLAVAASPEPLVVLQRAAPPPRGGSALELLDAGGRSTRLEMNVTMLDASGGAVDRLAVLVEPLPPMLHPHCGMNRPSPASIVVLRR